MYRDADGNLIISALNNNKNEFYYINKEQFQ